MMNCSKRLDELNNEKLKWYKKEYTCSFRGKIVSFKRKITNYRGRNYSWSVRPHLLLSVRPHPLPLHTTSVELG